MNAVLLVAAGGAIGASLRYLGALALGRPGSGDFPLATFVINVVGCFLIGVFAGVADSRPFATDAPRLFLVVGILGGFTTFSTFGLESFELLRRGQSLLAVFYVTVHCVIGTAAVAAGFQLLRAR